MNQALLIGIGESGENDAILMAKTLIESGQFKPKEVHLLVGKKATLKAIQKALIDGHKSKKWLVHYSGIKPS